MSAEPETLGLRERKKIRTRATIREHAMRLFAEQGYAETTVEQIAEAAEVSPSTLFRYFPSKERLVLTDDLDPVLLTSFVDQPADLPLLTAFRRSIESVFLRLSPEEREQEERRQRLIYSVPELRAAQMDELLRTIDLLGQAVTDRLGGDADPFEVRVFAGALAGAVLGTVRGEPPRISELLRAIEVLESGFPLVRAIEAARTSGSA
ncbi:TetR/AcrR family transcriptional regulator [Micromonospora sp. NBC_01796]|uniref:TetR/AcrR family transcriptional regulator n=1 Tax=Micromonospora sp. NBC_01796 TaxID=2975987 RepID=UPI002DDA3DE7|nr:TetR family transcriptional regulator [Micromonospora sp. NBC_01796]WSA84670.1 TetR family transcriptional regulator [Micromonospora sp. NBC_01796]